MSSSLISQKQFEFDPPARITKQAGKILERLQQGEVTNAELATIAIRYSARIHELRKAGRKIEIIKHDRESGICVYRLQNDVCDTLQRTGVPEV